MEYVVNLTTATRDFYDEEGELLYSLPLWKTPYNHNTNDESDRSGLECQDASRTQQQFKDDADMNNIIDRFTKTGQLPDVQLPPQFGEEQDMDPLMMRVALAEANATFYRLDPKIRAAYQNEPGLWQIDMMRALEANDRAYMRERGIKIEDKPQEPGTPTTGTPAVVPQDGPPSGPPKAPTGA